MNYWIKVYGWRRGLRIIAARTIGPVFPLAWYLAPKHNRDKWHRIACDDPECQDCADYYSALFEDLTELEKQRLADAAYVECNSASESPF